MTRLTLKEINCPHCGNSYKIVWEASINTWLNLYLIRKILEDEYFFYCPNCDKGIHLDTKILINCPEGMFWVSTSDNLDAKKEFLRKNKVLNESGEIVMPTLLDTPKEDYSKLSSNSLKELDSLKDKLSKGKKDTDRMAD